MTVFYVNSQHLAKSFDVNETVQKWNRGGSILELEVWNMSLHELAMFHISVGILQSVLLKRGRKSEFVCLALLGFIFTKE